MKHHKKITPYVSICTPTFNRRPFIPYLIKCIEQQTYPKDHIEWVIIDDGTDKVQDLFDAAIATKSPLLPTIKYYAQEKQMTLGKKRNLMHEKCTGSIIVYIDDDDYYPPERVSHAVETLTNNPEALCAGSSEMHIYYDDIRMLYQCGPYAPSHATAATFAFRKELLNFTHYDNVNAVGEERAFLKDYTVPFVQLETTKTILVVSHIHNSVDKKMMITKPNAFVKPSVRSLDDFIKNPELKEFYTKNLNQLLTHYPEGKPMHKPEMMKQIRKLEEDYDKMMQEEQEKHAQMQQNVSNEQMQMIAHINELRAICANQDNMIKQKDTLIQALMKQNKELKDKLVKYETPK
jgi:glycosyltransferase involved in cell wall biosynthesis